MTDEEIKDEKVAASLRAVLKAVDDFNEKYRAKSYAQRHPELGKKINCVICKERHYAPRCKEKYAVSRLGVPLGPCETRNGVLGAKMFAKKRLLPHHSHKLLQLVQRTQQLFPKYEKLDIQVNGASIEPVELMKFARTQAKRQLKKERAIKVDKKRQQQDVSRRINLGLLPFGSRV